MKVKLSNIHLAVAQDGRIHAGTFAGEDKTKMLAHKDIHNDFLSCIVTRFGNKPEMIKSSDGTMYMVMVQQMKKATDDEKKLILGEDKKLILPGNGLKKI